MRAIVAGRDIRALGLLVAWLIATTVARAAPPALPEIELRAPADCASKEQFATLLRSRLAAGAPAGARLVLELVVAEGANVRASLAVVRASGRIERRLEAASCAEALSALALVAALILDPTPAQADAPAVRAARPGRSTAARGSSSAAPAAVGAAAAASTPAEQAAASAPRESPAASTPEAALPAASSPAATGQAPEKAGDSSSTSAHMAEAVGAAAASGETRPDGPSSMTPARTPRRGRARFALDGYAALSMMTGLAPGIRPGAVLGLGLGGRWSRFVLGAELDARAALPQQVESSEGAARFGFWGAGVKLCALGLLLSGRLGLSGCAISEAGVLLASGSETEQPNDSREPWAALGPGLGLSWRSAGRIWLRLGSELLLPLTRPSYTLGDEPLFSVPPVTFRLELALGVKLL